MNSNPASRLRPITLWVWLCAILNGAGWILSACHALNPAGYLVVFALAVGGFILWQLRTGGVALRMATAKKLRWRFRRMLPAGFAVVAALTVLGGILHPPSNYDALAYRVPRVLHWLAAEQWHWIHTDFQRLNTRAAGFEWVATPLTAFTHTDRWWFLINIPSLLLLPGLVFSLYTRLGVHRRVAWCWMWLLPTGYSFILQAGGIGNDIFGAVFPLAAVDLALRARVSGKFGEVAASCLALALLTAAKTSNLPLGLPWLIAVFPCWRILLRRPWATAGVAALALLCSFLPTAMMNHRHVGDWTGAHAENMYPERNDPRVTIPGNVLVITVQNLAPPVFPQVGRWNAFAPRLMTESFHQRMKNHFEPSGANLALTELQNEEFSGLGFGLSCLVVVSLAAGWLMRPGAYTARSKSIQLRLLRWSPWVSALVYSAKSAIGTAARIFTPYYLLLLPALLRGPAQAALLRKKWWQAAAAGVFCLAALLVIITPSRPLWPAETVLAALAHYYPNNSTIERTRTVFEVYRQRADALAAMRAALPTEERVIGAVTSDDPETSLWRPFGSRRVLHVRRSDTREEIMARGIRCIAVNAEHIRQGENFSDWVNRVGGKIEKRIPMRYRAARDAFDWYLVTLEAPAPAPQ